MAQFIQTENISNIALFVVDEARDFLVMASSMGDSKRRNRKHNDACSMSDTLFICNGSIAITDNTIDIVRSCFTTINETLKSTKCRALVLRNNNSDPKYFNDERIVLSNIETVKDYTTVCANGKNILLVGGAVSPNRSWKIRQEELINKYKPNGEKMRKIFFEGEEIQYDESKIESALMEADDIHAVVFCAPPYNSKRDKLFEPQKWFKNADDLKESVRSQRETMKKIVEKLSENHEGKFFVFTCGHSLTPISNDEKDIFVVDTCNDTITVMSEIEALSERVSEPKAYFDLKSVYQGFDVKIPF